MDFKVKHLKPILFVSLCFVLFIGLFVWRSSLKAASLDPETMPPIQEVPATQEASPVIVKESDNSKEDEVIQRQLDRDRLEQKQTKYLKNKLEQTNLELEQEKAIAEINKLKMENGGTFNDPDTGEQKNLPDVKIEYIGGSNTKKEAILSIAGVNYQVKEKSSPIDSIQVVAISDSGVTLHFSAPQELTKTIDYRPE